MLHQTGKTTPSPTQLQQVTDKVNRCQGLAESLRLSLLHLASNDPGGAALAVSFPLSQCAAVLSEHLTDIIGALDEMSGPASPVS